MRVELLVDRVMALGLQNAGDKIDVPDSEALRMIEAGQAVAVRNVTPETAVSKRKPERAAKGLK